VIPWLVAYAVLIVATVGALLFVRAPYGRHVRSGWGPSLPARWGWVLMESPSALGILPLFLVNRPAGIVPWVLLAIWLAHYGQRTFVFPFLMRGRPMPLSVVGLGFSFNVFNVWVQARWLTTWSSYETSWLLDPRFLVGVGIFVAGMVINLRSDHILRHLRAPGERGYRIPRGFLFRWVSCPNYLGEALEWFGWALLTWSPTGLCFALYTLANLGPRAVQNHRWYHEQFDDYPQERRALVPFIL